MVPFSLLMRCCSSHPEFDADFPVHIRLPICVFPGSVSLWSAVFLPRSPQVVDAVWRRSNITSANLKADSATNRLWWLIPHVPSVLEGHWGNPPTWLSACTAIPAVVQISLAATSPMLLCIVVLCIGVY